MKKYICIILILSLWASIGEAQIPNRNNASVTDFFIEATPQGNGWYYEPHIGWFDATNWPWIWQADKLGWVYCYSHVGGTQWYFCDSCEGWWYSDESRYPWAWAYDLPIPNATGSWVYHNGLVAGDIRDIYVDTSDRNKEWMITSDGQTSRKGDWLFIVYLDADNNLESAGIADFNEMEAGLAQLPVAVRNETEVLVLMDRIAGYDSSNGDWTDTRLFSINPDTGSAINSSLIANWGEKNMADPSTLDALLSQVDQGYFGYSHVVLICWNHGGGARSANNYTMKDICWDSTSGNDFLRINEVQTVLNAQSKLDILGMDACYMGTVEVAYEFRNNCDFFVASPESEAGDGWEYDDLFSRITAGMTASQMAEAMVRSHESHYNPMNAMQTLTAVDCSKLPVLVSRINSLAGLLYSQADSTNFATTLSSSWDYSDYVDVGSMCINIMSSSLNYNTTVKTAASQVIASLNDAILLGWGDVYSPAYFSASPCYGLTLLKVDQVWYTSAPYGALDGNIDFAGSGTPGIVDTWKDLLNAWF